MTQILSPICLLKPQIWGIPPETVTLLAVAHKSGRSNQSIVFVYLCTVVGLVLEMEYLQMLTFIQTYRKNFEFKVLTTSRWGTVETLKHDCLTDDVEFGDFPIFRFQINYGLCASSLRMSTKLEISTGGNFQTHL